MNFTCLSTRAVYLDIAASLSMNNCLNVFQRFLATYGDKIKCFYSDNGTNFAGTDKAILQMYDRINKQKYKRHFVNKSIVWHFNTPLACRQGGAWELMTCGVSKLLTVLPNDPQSKTVSNDDLHTMLTGAQIILNARQLNTIMNSVDDCNAIMLMNFINNTTDTSATNPIADLSTHGKLVASYSVFLHSSQS